MEDSEWKASNQTDKNKDKDADGPLGSIRNRIDHVDALLMRLLSERMQLSLMVANIKNTASIPVRDRERERQVLAGISEVSNDDAIVSALTAVYQTILTRSRDLQAKTALTHGSVYFREVMIVGLGLIGGAMARRIRMVLPESKITGCDRHEVLQAAIQEKLIDASADPCASIPDGVQLILLCAPPAANIELLRRIAPHLGPSQVVLDVSSTKQSICTEAESIDLHGADFIGGHPFFGTENSGLASSKEVAVEGKTFCVIPTSKSSELTVLRLSRWLNALGLNVQTMDAQTHDAVAARVSHINQLVATALGASIAHDLNEEQLETLAYAGGPSFKNMVRLMSSPYELWTEILLDNSTEVVRTVDGLVERLTQLRDAIASGDKNAIKENFDAARKLSSKQRHD